ncbi:MAG: sugar transferase [Proteobacteria bacterium]|nr:MAG: sugar transferase [Pseudomonadota bacterium]
MFAKRIFDFIVSALLLLFFGWAMLLFWLLAAIDTRSSGLFFQTRVGQFGRYFTIIKLRSMRDEGNTKQISSYGRWMRKYKIDELPQFLHVFVGQMSLVGPRPDVPGYYDQLQGEAREILKLKPGITSLAALKYANEEAILSKQADPLHYNDTVLFPDKVRMNLEYARHRRFSGDVRLLFATFRTFTSDTHTHE